MTLRLLSYNIRKARGTDLRRRPARVLEVINRSGADIVLLQEADLRLGARPTALPRDMIAADTDLHVAHLAGMPESLGWHGNALLLRREMSVSHSQRLHLPGLEPRGAILCEIATPDGVLIVVGVHLALLRPWRRRQISAILSQLDDVQIRRSVIAGDFNEWSRQAGLEGLAATHEVHAPGKTFPATRPIAALDRIALGQHLRLEGAGVETSALARSSSDHLPIWADISWLHPQERQG
ncbi:MAG: endonuclease/exonuclease/phosphatase family protein [Pseudomonadota bacterium]